MPFQSGSAARAALTGLAVIGLSALAACGGGLGLHRTPAAKPDAANAIGVNSYLWRATLDTLAFMPLASADPYGGVVITDWYVNPEKPDERFKCTVYILDTRLRGDALKVTVFKEVGNGGGGWSPSEPSDQTSIDIENSILTRARQLRLSNLRG
jgi:predicted small lipoprotein YifL